MPHSNPELDVLREVLRVDVALDLLKRQLGTVLGSPLLASFNNMQSEPRGGSDLEGVGVPASSARRAILRLAPPVREQLCPFRVFTNLHRHPRPPPP